MVGNIYKSNQAECCRFKIFVSSSCYTHIKMLKIILLVGLTVNVLVDSMPLDPPVIEGHVVGGNDTDISQVPYQIAMYINGYFTCGGSIVSPTHIVTAAHCVYKKPENNIIIRAGSSSNKEGGVVIKTKKIHIDHKYNRTTKDYDVAVIELETPLKYNNKTIKPIKLVAKEPTAGTPVVASGWGDLKESGGRPEILQSVVVPVVDREICARSYKTEFMVITPRMICAGLEGKDTCQGDSGGPLTYKGELVGIVSFGIGCARKDFAGVYTNIADPEITKFIKDIVKS